jgi:hypothetical protein
LKCDEKPKTRDKFEPVSPLVIVCEGYRDARFICVLLNRLGITNCDVTFPQQARVEAADGDSGIPIMVGLLCERETVEGIAVVRDADLDAKDSFRKVCEGYVKPFTAPKEAFSVERKTKASGVFLVPGKGQTGTLEDLFIKAVSADHPELIDCVKKFEACNGRSGGWSDNKKAKLRMQCAIAGFCQDDPACSLAYIWSKDEDNPINIAHQAFKELASFLREFSTVLEPQESNPGQ